MRFGGKNEKERIMDEANDTEQRFDGVSVC